MWVLLSALTVVVVFCFVAFYLNHAEVREMHSGLQAEIDLAGQSAVSSMERSLASLRLERIPEAQESLDRFMKEKEHQDKQRFGEILEEVRKQGTRSQVGRREDFQTIDDHLSALRQLSEEIHQIQLQSLRNASRIPEDIALINPGNGEVKAGWAARAPDGAPRTGPPDSAERPPSQDSQEKVEKIETVGSEKPKSENTNDN